MPPVVNGLSSGTAAFPSSALTIGAASSSAMVSSSWPVWRGVDQIAVMVPRDRQNRLPVDLGVVEPVQQMDPARTRGGDADPEPAGIFGVSAGHEGRRLLVPDLDETDFILALPQRLDEA